MTPSILIAGATGNTGISAVETLATLLKSSQTLSSYRIIATTRSPDSEASLALAKLPGVDVLQKSWPEITPEWLIEHKVERAFIASHLEQTQFPEETSFLLAALNASVQYVVRISTYEGTVRPDAKAYYGRQHWAVEALLSSPEFAGLEWTSLRPNGFANQLLAPAADFIRNYQKTGKQTPLKTMMSEDAPIAMIDPYDVGVAAAHLLAQDDFSVHNRAKYSLSGPESITGRQVVGLIEHYIGVPVEDVKYQDLTILDWLYENQYAASGQSKNIFFSVKYACESLWTRKAATPTSEAVKRFGLTPRTPAEVLSTLLKDSI